jgi:hypothetical protein
VLWLSGRLAFPAAAIRSVDAGPADAHVGGVAAHQDAPAQSYRVLPEPPMLQDGASGAVVGSDWVPHADVMALLGEPSGSGLLASQGHDQRVRASYVEQEQRRAGLADELSRLHGQAAIRPFFVFGEGVFNTQVGRWMVEVLNLLPYDAWNTTYLPLDAPTAAAMRLPYHPRRSLDRIDTLILERLTAQHERHDAALARCVEALRANPDEARLARFLNWRDALRSEILAFAEQVRPVVVGLLREAQDTGVTL